MRQVKFRIKGLSPYQPSRYHNTPKKDDETNEDYRNRTWREQAHFDKQGRVFIPPMAVKNALSECAAYIKKKIPGKGNQTYTKNVEAGVLIHQPLYLGINKDDLVSEDLFLNADGKRGGGTRVMKRFPVIHEWEAEGEAVIIDGEVSPEVFEEFLRKSGQIIGLGRFRPRKNGFYGRFEVTHFEEVSVD